MELDLCRIDWVAVSAIASFAMVVAYRVEKNLKNNDSFKKNRIFVLKFKSKTYR